MRLSAAVFISALAVSSISQSASAAETETAIFAGGCFWCVESDFDHVDGVISTVSGYTGGTSENPTYHNHTAAMHREAVEIKYDPSKVTYRQLVDVFFRSVNPTDPGGQFCDRGHSYTTAVYALDDAQLKTAKEARAEAQTHLTREIVTPIEPAARFWPAEDYHQDYYNKNPIRYSYYRKGCGRDAAIEQLWGSEAHKGIAAH